MVFSGAIHGVDWSTHELPTEIADQSANVFANMLAIVEAAGGSTGGVIKVEIYLRDSSDRGCRQHGMGSNVSRSQVAPGPARSATAAR